MHETFWTLVRDRAHWEFEIFLMMFFDVVLAGIWLFFVRATARWRKAQVIKLQTPTGICDGCGGTVKHLIESGIEWCFGCGEIKVAEPTTWAMNDTAIQNGHTYHYTLDKPISGNRE